MNLTTDEIERSANRLLEEAIENIFQENGAYQLRPYELHQLKEKGIDHIFEIEKRHSPPENSFPFDNSLIGSFYNQNKGTTKEITPLKNGEYKGKISFQLHDIWHVKYFCEELDHVMIFTLCDLERRSIYYLPIQLFSNIYLEKYSIAKQKGSDSIQIYIDPKKRLLQNGKIAANAFNELISDIKEVKTYLNKVWNDRFSNDVIFGKNELESFEWKNEIDVLSNWYSFFESLHREVEFFPSNILRRRIKTFLNQAKFPFYTSFTLSLEHSESLNFFHSIEISEYNKVIKIGDERIKINDRKQQITTVLSKFTQQLIFNIEDERDRRLIDVRFIDQSKCDCIRCSYQRFEFGRVLELSDQLTGNALEDIKTAYINGKIGLEELSANQLLETKVKCAKEFPLLHFIIEHNLKYLYQFLRNPFTGSKNEKLLKKIDNINLDQAYRRYSGDHQDFIKYLYTKSFLETAQFRIKKKLNEIRNHYYSQLEGGASWNNHGMEIISEYLELYSFLNNNCIIYDEFLEFKEISDMFMEAVIASHAIYRKQDGRIKYFDDFIIKVIILYCDAKNLKEYLKRYNLESIAYKSSLGSEKIFDLLNNLMASGDSLVVHFKQENTFGFKTTYQKFFSTLLTLLSFLEVDSKKLKEVTSNVFDFISNPNPLIPNKLSEVWYFLDKRSEVLSNSIVKSFFFWSLNNPSKFDSLRGLEVCSSIISEKNISFNKHESNKLIGLLSIKLPEIQSSSKNFLVNLGRSSQLEILNEFFKSKIIESLDQDFDSTLHYRATFWGVLSETERFFDIHRKRAKPNERWKQNLGLFGVLPRPRYYPLDQFLDLCLKLNKDTIAFTELKGIDPYYDWLMNIEGFDYSNFDPEWVADQTVTFYEHVSKYSVVKKAITDYLKINHDSKVERAYFIMYKG